MMADLHNVNRVLEKVNMKESGVCYGHIGNKEELKLIGIGDILFKTSEKAGAVLLLANKNLTKASPINWNLK